MSRTLPRPIRGRGRSLASMVVIGQNFQSGGVARARERQTIEGNSSLRQRNELMFVGNMGKTAGFPVLFCLLDPFLGGGDEIPPDVARALQGVAAEKHHPGWSCRLDRDAVAGAEDQQPRSFKATAGYLDFAVDHIDRALLLVGIERHAGLLFGG